MAWIEDPERRKPNLHADLNLAMFKSLTGNRIEIAFPQRDVHVIGMEKNGAQTAQVQVT